MPTLLDDLLTCETAVWDALVQGDAEADARALDEAFLGVYPDGFAGKADHVGQLDQGPTVTRYAISEPRVLPLAEDVASLSYRAEFERPGHGAEAMYVTSIWRRQGTGWINIFSQDTPAT